MTAQPPVDAGARAEQLRAACGAFLGAFVLGLPEAGQRQLHAALKAGERFAVSVQLQPAATISIVVGEEVLAALRIEAPELVLH